MQKTEPEWPMIAVIFEVEPDPGHKSLYLDTAAGLRPELEQIDGFISVERFQSITDPGKLLSISFFRDEACLKEWRNLDSHRKAQAMGRSGVFRNYRLRVAEVLRDYGMDERTEAPADSRLAHDAPRS
jgi:heme-degrading monooxygenase HmoA